MLKSNNLWTITILTLLPLILTYIIRHFWIWKTKQTRSSRTHHMQFRSATESLKTQHAVKQSTKEQEFKIIFQTLIYQILKLLLTLLTHWEQGGFLKPAQYYSFRNWKPQIILLDIEIQKGKKKHPWLGTDFREVHLGRQFAVTWEFP